MHANNVHEQIEFWIECRTSPNSYKFDEMQNDGTCELLSKNGSARLPGIDPPRFEDTETTIEALKERVAKTLTFLKAVDRKGIDGSRDKDLTFPLGPEIRAT